MTSPSSRVHPGAVTGAPAAGTGDRPAIPETHAEAFLYTQAGCAESAQVRSWLTERGIPFVERNVNADPEAAAALAATGTFATPLLVVGEKKVLGFRPEALLSALDNNGDPIP
jgi:glutaredoxin-like protein NrdH